MNISVFVILAFFCSHVFAGDETCSDVSGRYAFLGSWNKFEFRGGDPRAHAQFKERYARPRFDYFALGFLFERIYPVSVRLRLDQPAGKLLLDMANDEGGRGQVEFPVPQVAVRCSEGRWLIESERSGGGENVISTTFRKIYLKKNLAGNLYVEGESRIVKGWLFKTEENFNWAAEFNFQADQ